MERYSGHEMAPAQIWTYDRIFRDNWLGSVKEPLVVTTESGLRAVPVVLDYKKDDKGDRQSLLLPGKYRKALYRYEDAALFRGNPEVGKYLIWDKEADVSILALPLDKDARIFSAREIVYRLLEGFSPHSEILKRIVGFFPQVDFGLLGSWTSLLANGMSDLDMFIYGGDDFEMVTAMLRNPYVQRFLEIEPISTDAQKTYAERYSQRFNLSLEQAQRVALLRSRYVSDGIKIAFSGCFSREEYQMQTVLGSRKMGKIQEEGIALETRNSASFPREYVVDVANQPLRVISSIWVLQRMVETGDRVIVRGNLRQKDGVNFVSLEDQSDIIIKK